MIYRELTSTQLSEECDKYIKYNFKDPDTEELKTELIYLKETIKDL